MSEESTTASVDQLKLDVKVITYQSIVARMREIGSPVKVDDLVNVIAEQRKWDISDKERKVVVRTHIRGLVMAGVTVGEIVRVGEGRYQHLNEEDRERIHKEMEKRADLLARARRTIADLNLSHTSASVTDQHVIMTLEAFLECCE